MYSRHFETKLTDSLQTIVDILPFEPGPDEHFASSLQEVIARGFWQKPDAMNAHFWNFLQMCWRRNPEERPTMAAVVAELENLASL